MVTITADGYFTDLKVESVNGLYLCKNDIVFVYIDDAFISPLILGRATGQLELTELVNVINKLIDIINNDKDAFDEHTHALNATTGALIMSPVGPCVVSGVVPLTSASDQTGLKTGSIGKSFVKADKIKEDDILKEHPKQ